LAIGSLGGIALLVGLGYFKSDALKQLVCHCSCFDWKNLIFKHSGPVSLLVNTELSMQHCCERN